MWSFRSRLSRSVVFLRISGVNLEVYVYMVVRALEFQEKALVRAIKVFLKTDVDFLRKNRSFAVRKR